MNNHISKEFARQILAGDISKDELRKICQSDILSIGYYDYDLIRSTIVRKLNGEFDDSFFKDWLITVCRIIDGKNRWDLVYCIDGYTWTDEYDKETIQCLLSDIKDFDYKLRHKNYMESHRKEKLRVIYLRLEHCNRTADSGIYKAYFVDYKNKRFDIRLIDDATFEFKDELLYCSIEVDDKERENEDFEDPRYTWQEEVLLGHFFNDREHWIYDHSLNF